MSIRLAKRSPPAWVCSPLVAKRLHSTNMTLDIAETFRAAKLIEVLHNTKVDWGRMHRWWCIPLARHGPRGLAWFSRAVRTRPWRVLRDVAPTPLRGSFHLRNPGVNPTVRAPWLLVRRLVTRNYELISMGRGEVTGLLPGIVVPCATRAFQQGALLIEPGWRRCVSHRATGLRWISGCPLSAHEAWNGASGWSWGDSVQPAR